MHPEPRVGRRLRRGGCRNGGRLNQIRTTHQLSLARAYDTAIRSPPCTCRSSSLGPRPTAAALPKTRVIDVERDQHQSVAARGAKRHRPGSAPPTSVASSTGSERPAKRAALAVHQGRAPRGPQRPRANAAAKADPLTWSRGRGVDQRPLSRCEPRRRAVARGSRRLQRRDFAEPRSTSASSRQQLLAPMGRRPRVRVLPLRNFAAAMTREAPPRHAPPYEPSSTRQRSINAWRS